MSDEETTNLEQADAAAEPELEPDVDVDAESEAAETVEAPTGWRSLWQAPTLIIAGLGLAIGLGIVMSTQPDPSVDPALTQAEALIDAERYDEAIELLNTRVYPWVASREGVRASEQIRYHIQKARAIDRGQRTLGFDLEENNHSIVREYLEAERIGALLEPMDIASLSRTYMRLDDLDNAIKRLKQIPDDARATKSAIQREIVVNLLNRIKPRTTEASKILSDMLADTGLSAEDQVWALERSARIRLDDGYVDETITRILRAMPRLERSGVSGRARLHLILAQAYLALQAYDHTREQIQFAYALSGAGDEHYARIILAHAHLEDIEGNTLEARDLYSQIVENFARDRAYPDALLGLGETESGLGETELSIDAYARLVDNYDTLSIETEPTRERVTRSLLERAGDQLAAGNPRDAIRYCELADRFNRGRDIPNGVLEMYTRAHVAEAENLLGQPVSETSTLLHLDPSTRVEVQRHLLVAAANARLHAERFVISDIGQYADSLWEAADLFDRAGDHREAITAFQTYADSMPSDPRYAEALFRLAEALRSVGEYQNAAAIFQRLLEERGGTLGADIGPFADASMVPLAQAYLYDEDPNNDAQAERLLLETLDGTRISTETDLYREALIELAGYYDNNGRAERAIERYDEYVARYEGKPETAVVVYRLADAHRRLSNTIRASLDQPMPGKERAQREAKIRRHLEEAIEFYEKAIGALSALDVRETGIFEATALRNAYFYIGDCAYDLGRYDEAIRAYDIARDRYAEDPASLVAMIQIVNAYIELGELGRAKTANERARRFYATIPDQVWDNPDLPMDREDWERWLNSSSTLLTEVPTP